MLTLLSWAVLNSPKPHRFSPEMMEGENEDGEKTKKTVIFGKYEMGTLLGQGTFAKVYRGTSLVGGESVAIKVYKKEGFRRDAVITELIKREISIMRLVRHPNVVELKEVMANRNKIFFVMEYVRGGDLFAQIAKGRVKEDLARKYFQQMICAIDFCHSRDVAHRDLKPENILVDEDGNLKISDFGLSALPEQKWSDGLLHTECGTPAYVAPEVLRKKGYDGFKTDIWSAGVVLFVLLAGYLPFQDPNLNRMYRKVLKAEFRVPNWVSLGAKGLISRLLVVDPAKRATIAEIMRHPWFLKDYNARPLPSLPQENGGEGLTGDVVFKPQPPFYNAFELITSMASGFDLSGLFESERRAGSVFTAKCSASGVVERLRSLATEVNFSFAMEKGYKVRMRGKGKGRGGIIMVAAKVFEVAPEVAVVELFKCAGDTLEYAKFCEEVARPALKDIVWCWQGEY